MEVCVDNLESAYNAEKGGASRIELCSSLKEGGLTPSIGFLRIVKSRIGIPIFVMIRCRAGDFVYTDDEIQVMLADIRLLKESGADGFVIGVLDINRNVDYKKSKTLVDECSPFPVTFHRAFDEVVNPLENFQQILKLGCSRLLTSGCKPSASDGITLIKELTRQDNLIVMPGSGITVDNLDQILKETGAREFHGSAKVWKESQNYYVTDAELVRQMTEIYKKVLFCKQCTSCYCNHNAINK